MAEPINYGLALALSYRNDWDADMQRLAQNGERIRQAKADAEAKMAFYAEKFKMPPTSNDYDRTQLEKYMTDNVMPELKSFKEKNPNWMSTLEGQLEFSTLSNKVVNNEYTIRDARVKGSYDKFKKDAMDGKLDEDEIALYDQQFENYSKFGNINGPNDNGQVQEFTYMKPEEFDLQANLKKYGSLGRKPIIVEDGRKTYVKKELSRSDAIIQATTNIADNYSKLNRIYQKEKQKSGFIEDRYPTLLDWVTDGIMANAESDISSLYIEPIHYPSAAEIEANNKNNYSFNPYITDVEMPLKANKNRPGTKGIVSALTPWIEPSGGKVYKREPFAVRIDGKSFMVNATNKEYRFTPNVDPESAKSNISENVKGEKASSSSVSSKGLKSYDGNRYEWENMTIGTDQTAPFAFHEVIASKADLNKMYHDNKSLNQSFTSDEMMKYLDARKTSNGNYVITIGTEIDPKGAASYNDIRTGTRTRTFEQQQPTHIGEDFTTVPNQEEEEYER